MAQRAGIIGFGKMGRTRAAALEKDGRAVVSKVYDNDLPSDVSYPVAESIEAIVYVTRKLTSFLSAFRTTSTSRRRWLRCVPASTYSVKSLLHSMPTRCVKLSRLSACAVKF